MSDLRGLDVTILVHCMLISPLFFQKGIGSLRMDHGVTGTRDVVSISLQIVECVKLISVPNTSNNGVRSHTMSYPDPSSYLECVFTSSPFPNRSLYPPNWYQSPKKKTPSPRPFPWPDPLRLDCNAPPLPSLIIPSPVEKGVYRHRRYTKQLRYLGLALALLLSLLSRQRFELQERLDLVLRL